MNDTLTVWSDNNNVEEIRKIFAPTLTETEFKTFMGIGMATGLNPFLREIWAVKYRTGDKASIFIGRDGYRKGAQRQQSYDFHYSEVVYSNDEFSVTGGVINHKFNLKDRGTILGAYSVAKRKEATQSVYSYVSFKEYNKGFSNWKTMPEVMIKKVAEATVLRMVWQELFAGTYDESENWNDDVVDVVEDNTVAIEKPKKKVKDITPIKKIETPPTIQQENDKKEGQSIMLRDGIIQLWVQVYEHFNKMDSDTYKLDDSAKFMDAKILKNYKVEKLTDLSLEQLENFYEELTDKLIQLTQK